MKFRFGAKSPKSWMLRFHAQTAGSTLTAQQPDVNGVRVALQALAAVLGGAQSLHTNSRDEALSLPTEEAAQLALRTQQVIAYESGVADVADPLGGSYALEALTTEIERHSEEYLDRIEAMGGMLSAIESGYVQREIQQSAFEYQKSIETGERVIVGVNKFVGEENLTVPIHRLDPGVESAQVTALQELKSGRDPLSVQQALDKIEREASGTGNLLPSIIQAVEVYATIGEISARLKQVFGEHRESMTL